MKRSELASTDPALFQALARQCQEGYLSLVTAGGFPRSLAVNFAATGETIYFHGALTGEKWERVQTDSKVGFALIQPLSYLPSSWSADNFACPATQLFRSVEIQGHCHLVQQEAEKGTGLQALMEKYQPEGGFTPIDTNPETYRTSLAKVGVFRVSAESWTGKVKLLQNESQSRADKIVSLLLARGEPLDLLTADLILQHR